MKYWFREGDGYLNYELEEITSTLDREVVLKRLLTTLGNIGRFNQRLSPEEDSVLSHSWVVWRASRALGLSEEEQLTCAIHDLHEAIIGDIPSPFKKIVPDIRVAESQLSSALLDFLEITNSPHTEMVETLDKGSAVVEAKYFMPSQMVHQMIKDRKVSTHLFTPEVYRVLLSQFFLSQKLNREEMAEDILQFVKDTCWKTSK